MIKISERPFSPEERRKIEADRIPDESGVTAKVIIYAALLVLAIPLSLLGMVFFGPLARFLLKGEARAMSYAYVCSLATALYAMFRVAHGDASLVQAWTTKPRFEADLLSKRIEEIEIADIVGARQIMGREALLLTTADQKCYLVACAGIDVAIPKKKLTLKRLRHANLALDCAFAGDPVACADPVPLEDVSRASSEDCVAIGTLNSSTIPKATEKPTA